MRFYFFLVLLLTIASEAFAIFGGQDAVAGQFPYQIQIDGTNEINGTILKCGGAIISEDWAITSAFCVFRIKNFTIRYGSNEQGTGEASTGADKIDVRRNANYDPNTQAYDIAVIKVSPKFNFTRASAVKLPPIRQSNFDYQFNEAVTSGFGDKGTAATPVYTLQFANMNILTNAKCAEVLNDNRVQKYTLCANAGARNCRYDYGNPLVLRNGRDNGTLAGLYSWGPDPNCETNLPNAFTRITFFLPWIRDTTNISYREN